MTTADRMAVLDQGVVQQVGTPLQLYDEPANAFVAHFVGTMNALPVMRQGVPHWLCLRPHHVVLEDRPVAGDDRQAWVWGAVQDREFLGEFTRYRVVLDGLEGLNCLGSVLGLDPMLPTASLGADGRPCVLQVDEPHGRGRSQRMRGQRLAVGLTVTEVRLLTR
jgi:hypothetical protein